MVSKHHSDYIKDLNTEFAGRIIRYGNTVLKFLNLQYVNNIEGCTSIYPSKMEQK